MEARFGPLDPPTDIWLCRACGRASRAIQGHPKVNYCYGCGAHGVAEETKESDPKAAHFGKDGWWPAPWPQQEVEWPGDVRYDPWTGQPVGLPWQGLRMEDWQRQKVGIASPPEFIQDSDPGDEHRHAPAPKKKSTKKSPKK